MTARAAQERYERFLFQLRTLSWVAYRDLMDAEADKPEADRHAAWGDPEFVRACAAFERHRCPHGGGRGATPRALRWDYQRGDWEIGPSAKTA